VGVAPITLCGSLSRLAVSLGAAMHNAGYAALGLRFTYVAFQVEDLAGALAGMRALGIRGFGVSMPFKQQILPLLDQLDPLAARIGAVNTVVNDGGRLCGHNTDWCGATRALGEALELRGRRVLLLGAGGAARAVAHGLSEAGARLTLSNRGAASGRALCAELGIDFVPWPERTTRGQDAVVNATSVGMVGAEGGAAQPSPLPEHELRPELMVMDLVYKPVDTPLLRAARRCGAQTVHGGRMLLFQAARQFELYTGCPAPLEPMERALEQAMAAQESGAGVGPQPTLPG
jgi:shikimate dehydrogenase